MQSNQTDSPISGKPSLKIGRTETLPRPLRIVFILLTVFGIAVYVIYNFGWTIAGRLMYPQGYYFLLFAMFMAGTFLILPARRKDRGHVPWYDLALAALAFCICIYFFFKAESINVSGWQPPRDTYNLALGVVFAALALEGARRLAGWPFLVLCLVAFVYPQFADKFPGILKGTQFDFDEMVSLFAFSRQGALGMPAMVLGEILIGFLVFCGIVLASGAGEFFLGLSLALLGNYRGGPAKVAVVSSAFFGSLSGNPLANIVTTGSVTIPAMKRLGYPAHYAGAIEACASNGGMIMPPVMGTIAFIIAVFIGVDYATVMIAAIIPAVLYYFGMLMQVDAYAAKVGLKGLPKAELPSIRAVLKKGWLFVAVLAFLVVGLLYFRWGLKAPLYAAGLAVVLSFFSRETLMTPKRIVDSLVTIGSMITQTAAIIIPTGFVISALTMTGTAAALISPLHQFGADNVFVVLLIAMAVCYVFGLIGMSLIAYIVLAVTMAPALVRISGMDILSLHLFLAYFALLGGLTPPVALLAFVAASVADAPPMKTAWTAMRLAVVIYFIPFFFVMNPSLLLRGDPVESVYLFVLCLIGITFIAGGLEGYLIRIGKLNPWQRIVFAVGGFLIAYPAVEVNLLSEWYTTIAGFLMVLPMASIMFRQRRQPKPESLSGITPTI